MPATKSLGYNLLLYTAAYGPAAVYLAIAAWSFLSAKPVYLLSLYISLSFTAFHIAAMRHFLRWARQREQNPGPTNALPSARKPAL